MIYIIVHYKSIGKILHSVIGNQENTWFDFVSKRYQLTQGWVGWSSHQRWRMLNNCKWWSFVIPKTLRYGSQVNINPSIFERFTESTSTESFQNQSGQLGRNILNDSTSPSFIQLCQFKCNLSACESMWRDKSC